MNAAPPPDVVAESMAFLDDMVATKHRARLSVTQEESGWWSARIEWDTQDGSDAPLVGFFQGGMTQHEAVCKLAHYIRGHVSELDPLSGPADGDARLT